MTVGLEKDLSSSFKQKLRDAFPDSEIDESDVEGFALGLQRKPPDTEGVEAEPDPAELEPHRPGLDVLAATVAASALSEIGEIRVARQGDVSSYYTVEATHTRKTPDGYKPFTGTLAMVRASLPATEPRRFSSLIGTVEPGDHLIATVHEANQKYAERLGYALQRVDLITPPRQLLRFAAVSVLLGYKDRAGLPTCYILEAGTATGQARVPYLGQTLDAVINRRTGYKPTKFSCSDNAYTGQLTVEGQHPVHLRVTARDIIGGNRNDSPYIEINAKFKLQEGDAIRSTWPGALIARAALIIEARTAQGLKNTCEDT